MVQVCHFHQGNADYPERILCLRFGLLPAVLVVSAAHSQRQCWRQEIV